MDKADKGIELPLRGTSDTRSSLYFSGPNYRPSEIIADKYSCLDRLEIEHKDKISLYYMMVSAACMSLNALLVKLNDDIPVFELLFLRTLFTGLVLVIYTWAFVKDWVIPTGENKRYAKFLILIGFVVSITYIYGVFNLDLAEAITILFASPMWVGLLAWLVFGNEFRPDENKWVLIIVLGIFLIWRPFTAENPDGTSRLLGTIVCVIHSFFQAATNTVVKLMPSRVDPLIISVMATAFTFVITGIGCIMTSWIWPNGTQWTHLIFMSILNLLGQFFAMKSVQTADSSNTDIGTLNYMQLPLAYIFDIFILGASPSIWSVAGTIFVLVGSVIIIKLR